jgi:hypothetical protein
MSVMPAALDATHIATRRAHLTGLLTACLGEEPKTAITHRVIEQTSKKINVVQASTSTRGAVTITRTGDKVFEALIASLDDQQKILLRGGYVKL